MHMEAPLGIHTSFGRPRHSLTIPAVTHLTQISPTAESEQYLNDTNGANGRRQLCSRLHIPNSLPEERSAP
jgi:hypothetical protein